jgi:hypothetical protein
VYKLPEEGTVVPKYVAVVKGYTGVYVPCALVGLVKENKLIKIQGESNFKTVHICLDLRHSLSLSLSLNLSLSKSLSLSLAIHLFPGAALHSESNHEVRM